MNRRPLMTAVCVFAAVLIFYTVFVPSFPLEDNKTKALAVMADEGEDVTAGGCVRSVSDQKFGALSVVLAPAIVTSSEGRSVRVKRLTVYPGSADSANMGNPDEVISAAGHHVTVTGRLKVAARATNPGQFDAYLYERLRGCPYQLTAASVTHISPGAVGVTGKLAALSARFRERIMRVYPGESQGIAAALLIGDRTLMTDDQKELWRKSGAAHILVISGLHLTLIGMGLFALLRKAGLPLAVSAVVTSVIIALYGVLTGSSISTLRALLMLVYGLGARVAGRCPDRLTAIALAALFILTDDPAYLLDAGFQLSFSAVLILAVFGRGGRLKTALLLFLFPLPLVVWHYYELPLFSLLFNLLFVPAVPSLLIIGSLGMIFGSPAAAIFNGLVYVAESLFSLIQNRVPLTYITGRPFLWQCFLYEVIAAAGMFFFWKVRKKKRRFLFLAAIPLMVLLLRRPSGREMTLTMLDIGQGDSFVLSAPEGLTCLIDSGSSSVEEAGEKRLIPYLMYEGCRRVDYVFVTHMDEDHISGVRELLKDVINRRTAIRIETLVLPYRPWTEACLTGNRTSPEVKTAEETALENYRELADLAWQAGARVRIMQAGDRLSFSPEGKGRTELLIEALGPDKETACHDENAASLVLVIHYGDFDALMTGDTGEEGETALTERLNDERPRRTYECLKVAHHGSRGSTSETFLERVNPQVSLISCGRNNWYGHPHEELLKRLSEIGTVIFRTDRDGAVRLTTDGERWKVKGFR